MALDILYECNHWLVTAPQHEKETVSFQLLSKLTALLDKHEFLFTRSVSLIDSHSSAISLENSVNSTTLNEKPVSTSLATSFSSSSVDTMIVYDEDECDCEDRITAVPSFQQQLEDAACILQKAWKMTQFQERIRDRRAMLESASSQTASTISSSLRSESSFVDSTEAGEFAALVNFKNSFSALQEFILDRTTGFGEQFSCCGVEEGIAEKIVKCWKGGMLCKQSFGEWLSGCGDVNRATLQRLLERFDFTGTFIVDALRSFLGSFQLPGEAQRIDRIINEFANRYQSQNSSSFETPDAVYILAFSIIMLNTDAHNFNVKCKMSLSQYVKNNLSVVASSNANLTASVLERVYRSVLKREIISAEEGKSKLNRIIQCTCLSDQMGLSSESFLQMFATETFLGAFQCLQISQGDSWHSILFRKERLALLTGGFLLLLRPSAKNSNKFECKLCKSFRYIKKAKFSTNLTTVIVQFTNESTSLSSMFPKENFHDARGNEKEVEDSDDVSSSIRLQFKMEEYALAFAELLNESLQEWTTRQHAMRQQKLKMSQQKAKYAKSVLESIYRVNKTAQISLPCQ